MTPMPEDEPVARKAALRRSVRARRRATTALRDREHDAERLAAAVLALADGQCGASTVCRVAAYVSTRLEPPTHRLVEALEAAGHEVILPMTGDDMRLHWTLRGSPLGAAAIGTAGLIVTPGLAVDRTGTRLGQGGGWYDRALALRGPGALVVTLLYDEELVPVLLPSEDHDVPVDAVITPALGIVRCATAG